mmetsp:Transcript_8094/g.10106  ORF Transcript_8094/g.10106 Transcript_8094/m.10106 type:complete len:143 (-) Transcript_8094:185-613(-)|eukprot:CAMPEP_0203690030 /NCGR_PEP_ID=MMETSP0091-20130426/2414_1 /ASSEMBLY_ACC=CAM_ASM_001089 /TAXON_ID=426623 /ORGANISM="Chaetoceros affinis, Strain CCMP159" /LENGTH=142 /DNA_ID=CAMNT_0050559963 /DNA_START=18 /DNA_END=446 /DNA_ORIENTATION=-
MTTLAANTKASRKHVASAESCGFVMHILCFPLALLYFGWVIIPDEMLHSMDITYYPPKYLAISAPTAIFMTFISMPFVYAFLNYVSAPSPDSSDTLWDESSIFLTRHDEKPHKKSSYIPEIHDIDVGIINQSMAKQFNKIKY